MHKSSRMPFWGPWFFLLLSLGIIVQVFQWIKNGRIIFKYIDPITREDNPIRFWINAIFGMLFGVILVVFVLYKMFTDPNWK